MVAVMFAVMAAVGLGLSRRARLSLTRLRFTPKNIFTPLPSDSHEPCTTL